MCHQDDVHWDPRMKIRSMIRCAVFLEDITPVLVLMLPGCHLAFENNLEKPTTTVISFCDAAWGILDVCAFTLLLYLMHPFLKEVMYASEELGLCQRNRVRKCQNLTDLNLDLQELVWSILWYSLITQDSSKRALEHVVV